MRADRRLAKRAFDGISKRSPGYEATRQANACSGPDEARCVLVHVAGNRTGNDRNAQGECPDECAMTCVADDGIAIGEGTGVGDPVDHAGIVGYRQRV
jgi:hypothetical protein